MLPTPLNGPHTLHATLVVAPPPNSSCLQQSQLPSTRDRARTSRRPLSSIGPLALSLSIPHPGFTVPFGHLEPPGKKQSKIPPRKLTGDRDRSQPRSDSCFSVVGKPILFFSEFSELVNLDVSTYPPPSGALIRCLLLKTKIGSRGSETQRQLETAPNPRPTRAAACTKKRWQVGKWTGRDPVGLFGPPGKHPSDYRWRMAASSTWD